MESVLVQANAKINLDLEITGKRKDGFHFIESTFQSIDLADFLFIEKAKRDEFSGAKICPDSQNVVIKAKEILQKLSCQRLACRIHLQKTIPISAGLGGGSADAAALMSGLNKLYKLKLSREQLAEVGVRAGADVPFFFYGGTCKIRGVGEKIKPIKKRLPKFFVLFRPHKRIETKKMYQLYDKTGKDFLSLAREICPEINELKKYFSKFNLNLRMSGSGPTVFTQVNDYGSAKKIAEGYPGFNGDIFICRPQDKGIIIK